MPSRCECLGFRHTLLYAVEDFKSSDLAPFLLELVQVAKFKTAGHAGTITGTTDNFLHEDLEVVLTGLFEAVRPTTVEGCRDVASEPIDTVRALDGSLRIAQRLSNVAIYQAVLTHGQVFSGSSVGRQSLEYGPSWSTYNDAGDVGRNFK